MLCRSPLGIGEHSWPRAAFPCAQPSPGLATWPWGLLGEPGIHHGGLAPTAGLAGTGPWQILAVQSEYCKVAPCVYIHVHTCMYTQAHTCTRMHTHLCTHIHICAHTCMPMLTRAHTNALTCTQVQTCTYTCPLTATCRCTGIHASTCTHAPHHGHCQVQHCHPTLGTGRCPTLGSKASRGVWGQAAPGAGFLP